MILNLELKLILDTIINYITKAISAYAIMY